jgi:molybdate/tungstate transport system substrate-binding protein
MDYVWSYESIAGDAGLRLVRLPDEIDLGAPGDSALYATASVRVAGRNPGDTTTFRGQPIVYGYAIPRQPPHPALAERFVAFLASAQGRAILRRKGLDVLAAPTVVGSGAPAALRGRR